MRIAFVAPFGRGQKTTVTSRIVPLAHELQCLGHFVQIVIPPWDTPDDAGKHVVVDGVELRNVTLSGGVVPVVHRMLTALERFDPDLVHIVKPRAHAGLAQWWLWHDPRWRHRIRVLLDVDDWEQAWAPINRYPAHVAAFLAWQEEWGIRHAEGVTAASSWLVQRVSCVRPETPVLYLPNGVDASIPAASPASRTSERRGVLFFSRFIEVPPAWLAEFWAALSQAVPNADLLIAGRGLQPDQEKPYRAALAPYLARPAGTAGHVRWVGYVQPATIDRLYADAACAIFPSTPIPLNQAKCSVRLATTLLRGVPVIASAVGEQVAYGSDGAAVLVPPDATPAQFAAAVTAVLEDSTSAAASSGRAHLLAHYRWDSLGARLDTFYRTFPPLRKVEHR